MKIRIFIITSLCLLGIHVTTVQGQSAMALNPMGTLDSLYSETLGETRPFWVQLPESYQPGSNTSYPVVILLDGEMWMPTLTNVHEFYSGGFMPEMILVGISNAENRTRDLTPTHVDTKYGMPFTEPNGEADRFAEFIAKELLPYLDETYPTTPYRTLLGHSYGGLFTVYMMLHHTDLFANYIAIDPSLEWDNQSLLRQAQEMWRFLPLENKSLYLAMSGQLHMQDASITIDNVMDDTSDYTLFSRSILGFYQFAQSASKDRFTVSHTFYPQDLHGTIPVPAIRSGLMKVFEWYQMEHTDEINSFETTMERLEEITRNRAAKLEANFGYAEPPYPDYLMNMLGYMSLEMGYPDKAKRVFELGIEYYPENANAYDSMADYYEQNGELAKALEFVEKAYQLSGSDYHRDRAAQLRAAKAGE